MFSEMFIQSKGQPIEYQGRLIQMIDSGTMPPHSILRITFESVDGSFKQGIRVKSNNGLSADGKNLKNIILWADTAPEVVDLVSGNRTTEWKIWNCWDHGDGVTQAWINGGAMIVELIGSDTKRYRCNDGFPDDDFSDLIFRVDIHAT